MKILARTSHDEIAAVFLASLPGNRLIEFVESTQPPLTRDLKWVLIISTLCGCPIKCPICDAGGEYQGPLSTDEILQQIEWMVRNRFPDGQVKTAKFKIQFSRMGEPAFNPAVPDVLERLPQLYPIPGLLPSLSTVAPASCEDFFDRLLYVRRKYYAGNFQMQFSLHTTDEEERESLIPAKIWDFRKISSYADSFFRQGDKKITLNFALASGSSFKPERLLDHFAPDRFILKLTPLNPTYRAMENGLRSYITGCRTSYPSIDQARNLGYEVLLSIGEQRENLIGSNCGQYVRRHQSLQAAPPDSYTYALEHAELSNPTKTEEAE
ncbi:MAG: radical SAM protein [Candidatus Wallbacteria bacterium]|nr:radical SAM protein [Candidatus Wallbacteria bacterium]